MADGPPTAGRSRCHRISQTAATAIVHYVQHLQSLVTEEKGSRPNHEEAPLAALAAVLAQMLGDESSDALAALPESAGTVRMRALEPTASLGTASAPTPMADRASAPRVSRRQYPMAVALGSRAKHLRRDAAHGPSDVTCWRRRDMWHAAFEHEVRMMWRALLRTAAGRRQLAGCRASAPAAAHLRVAPPSSPSAWPAPHVPLVSTPIGVLKNTHTDSEVPQPLQRRCPIRRYRPPLKAPCDDALARLLPYAPPPATYVTPSLRKHVQTPHAAVFQMGCVAEAKKGWAKQCRSMRRQHPLRSALSRLVYAQIAPTALAAAAGHLYDARTCLPLTLDQYAALMGKRRWMSALRAAQAVTTPAQMRALLGQSDHTAATELVLQRTAERLGPERKEALHSFGSLCCGVDGIGAAVFEWLGEGASYVFAAEGHPKARAAHVAFWAEMGQAPRLSAAADTRELTAALVPSPGGEPWRRGRAHRTPSAGAQLGVADVEILSPRCAPWSSKNRHFPKGCWAALRELRSILRRVRTRRPTVLLYENSSGLWKRRVWRRRIEAELRSLRSYRWESMRLSPHTHCGQPVRRERVYYVGILRA